MIQLGLVLAGYYAIREVTRAIFPLGLRVIDWIFGQVWRVARSLWRLAFRWCWTRPVQQFGLGITLFVWLCAYTVLSTVLLLLRVLVGLNFTLLPGVFLLWAFVIGAFFLLRWWAQRRYQPRPLPARRVRIRE